MKRPVIAAAICAVVALGATAASASDDHDKVRCNAPMTEWQPRENLRQKLEAEGWKVKRIKTDDGCYEVYAFDRNGNRVEAYYDPKSLEMLKRKSDD